MAADDPQTVIAREFSHPMQPEFGHVRGCLNPEYPTAREALDAIERRMEELLQDRASLTQQLQDAEKALREAHMQATRRKRASDLKRYLVTDLEIIERKTAAALAAAGTGETE